jgi:hypothetical protein
MKFFLFLFSLSLASYAQTKIFSGDNILVGKRKQATVLCVGSFHFEYYNADVYKTAKDKQVDILSPQRQKEVETLVSYIAQFKPTKIVIEEPQGGTSTLKHYKAFKSGKRKMGRDEIEQICFRLMNQFNIDTLYGADASTIFSDLYDSKDSLILRPTLDTIFMGWQNYNYKCEDPECKLYDSLQKAETEWALQTDLLSFFKYSNTDEALNRNYGLYFNGEYFKRGKYRGADALAMEWYNRNLRIYRNIQNVTTSVDDRILVLFGQGHVAILKHLFECDPKYKLIKFNELNNLSPAKK